MKFLVDAQLPQRLARRLRDAGHEVLHTRDLPLESRTPDEAINQLSLGESRVVITKDYDFVTSLLLQGKPHKLLLVSTGNINNSELLQLFESNLVQIVEALEEHSYIELSRHHLTVHL